MHYKARIFSFADMLRIFSFTDMLRVADMLRVKVFMSFLSVLYSSDSQPLCLGTFVCREIIKVWRHILDIFRMKSILIVNL